MSRENEAPIAVVPRNPRKATWARARRAQRVRHGGLQDAAAGAQAMTSPKVIAVTGATDTEGGAVARAAARQPLHRSLVDGTARSLTAAGAQSLADMESPASPGRASSKVMRAPAGLVLSAAAFV